MNNLFAKLVANLRATIALAIGHTPDKRALIVFDRRSPLASLLADGYQAVLLHAQALDFDQTTPEQIRAAVDTLTPGDLVILVQSSSFRLNDFRFRLELFNRQLAVVEHPHLGRMPEPEHATYIDSLAYDKDYYHSVGGKLKVAIDQAKTAVVSCAGTELVYTGPFEPAKLNIGDYTGLKNIGGQFPIGEVFTELHDLTQVNGQVKLFAFANADFKVIVPAEPILVNIKQGMIVSTPNATPEFLSVLDQIKTKEALCIRELGFGLNRAMTRQRLLTDIGSYERMCGIHLSLGEKHTVYAKAGLPKRSTRFHVDVFVDVTSVKIDDQVVFKDGVYII